MKTPNPYHGVGAVPDALDFGLGAFDTLLQRFVSRRVDYDSVLWGELVRDLSDLSPAEDVAGILAEPALLETEEHVRSLLDEIRPVDPFRRVWAADSVLARCCYLVCRLAKPRIAVETGVAYGVSSALVLRAMEVNGSGELHSIDLAPPGRRMKRFRGIAVPGELRRRWTLHPGSSRRVLGPLLKELGSVDLFLHDSLHTARNMRREFREVWPCLNPGGIILADDVERNGAFGGLLRRGPALWRVVCDRETRPLHGPKAPVTFGLAIK
ncbi:class I SAM-dependent methyltransferase [Rubrobacter indicoceani]|uniref:class I SAM-dependent methyltransferase n=1 Tax=Rubrobacter indicoceani TaxID=2051957 RepID=UPI000E5C4383|nr:class I SAM-dependent methyltransferase [Rubrobacter indicoceani]